MSKRNLLFIEANEEIEISSFLTSEDIRRKLATMSIVAGTTVKLMQKHKNGSVVIAKDNIRLALCFDIASKILIKE